MNRPLLALLSILVIAVTARLVQQQRSGGRAPTSSPATSGAIAERRTPAAERSVEATAEPRLSPTPTVKELIREIRRRELGDAQRGELVTLLCGKADREGAAKGLVALLGHLPTAPEEAQIRALIIRSLSAFTGFEKARSKICERLSDRSPRAERKHALEALSDRPGRWARPFLAELLETEHEDSELSRLARALLARRELRTPRSP
jgi:hypothetical protein